MKNIDFVIKKVADKNGIDEKLVAKVVNHHWKKDIKAELLKHDHPSIHLRSLGTIIYGKKKIRKAIHNCIMKIRRVEASNKFKEETKERIFRIEREKLRKLLIQRNITAIKYKQLDDTYRNKVLLKATTTRIEEPSESVERVD